MNASYGIIYLIKNNVDGKVYVGVTTKKNGFKGRYNCKGKGIERVYNFHKNLKSHQKLYNEHLYNSILKYGFDAWDINETLEICYTKEELMARERYWIKFYDSNNPQYGYNNTSGGDGLQGTIQNYGAILKRRIAYAKSRNQYILTYIGRNNRDYMSSFINEEDKHTIACNLFYGRDLKECIVCGLLFCSGTRIRCKTCCKPEGKQKYKEYTKGVKKM